MPWKRGLGSKGTEEKPGHGRGPVKVLGCPLGEEKGLSGGTEQVGCTWRSWVAVHMWTRGLQCQTGQNSSSVSVRAPCDVGSQVTKTVRTA